MVEEKRREVVSMMWEYFLQMETLLVNVKLIHLVMHCRAGDDRKLHMKWLKHLLPASFSLQTEIKLGRSGINKRPSENRRLLYCLSFPSSQRGWSAVISKWVQRGLRSEIEDMQTQLRSCWTAGRHGEREQEMIGLVNTPSEYRATSSRGWSRLPRRLGKLQTPNRFN